MDWCLPCCCAFLHCFNVQVFCKKANGTGFYDVVFCYNGIWRNLDVENYHECYTFGGVEPIISKNRKVRGGLDRLEDLLSVFQICMGIELG